jgi:flagellar biosynthesis component FlhA
VARQATLRRLFAAAALVALLAFALLLLRIVVSIALFVVAAVAGLLALAAGYLWLARRAADRDAATR